MAVKSKVKVKAHENLSDANIKKVIDLLEAEKPISKKEAYEILNIAQNPTRLAKIIDNYKSEQEEIARRKAANRGKPVQPFEIQTIIENFMDGDAVSEIAKRIYRSPNFVKEVIEQVGIPSRGKNGYWMPELIPEQCIRESFEPGQVVWNSKCNAMCIVREQRKASDPNFKYYQVYIIEPIEETEGRLFALDGYGGYYDGAYSYDLASLDHLKQYGVDVYRPYRPYFKNWLEGK